MKFKGIITLDEYKRLINEIISIKNSGELNSRERKYIEDLIRRSEKFYERMKGKSKRVIGIANTSLWTALASGLVLPSLSGAAIIGGIAASLFAPAGLILGAGIGAFGYKIKQELDEEITKEAEALLLEIKHLIDKYNQN